VARIHLVYNPFGIVLATVVVREADRFTYNPWK